MLARGMMPRAAAAMATATLLAVAFTCSTALGTTAAAVNHHHPPAASSSEKTPDPAIIRAQLKAGSIPSASIAVVTGNGTTGAATWSGSFGYANFTSSGKASTDTLYMLASVSKTVTAWACMQAVEAGALSLDADINARLPTWKVRNRGGGSTTVPITLRHLLTHTSCIGQTNIVDNWLVEPGDQQWDLGLWLVSQAMSIPDAPIHRDACE